MIAVNLPRSWPRVLAGELNAGDVTLGEWAAITDADLERYGDTLLGVHRNIVVTAFDITDWARTDEGRVQFEGTPSETWAHLVGGLVPGRPWVRGAARPVKMISTSLLTGEEVEPIVERSGRLRSVLGTTVITVDPDGTTTVEVVPGTRVVVITAPTSAGTEDDSAA